MWYVSDAFISTPNSPAATCLIRGLAGVQYDSSTTETTVANFVLSNPNVRNLDF